MFYVETLEFTNGIEVSVNRRKRITFMAAHKLYWDMVVPLIAECPSAALLTIDVDIDNYKIPENKQLDVLTSITIADSGTVRKYSLVYVKNPNLI